MTRSFRYSHLYIHTNILKIKKLIDLFRCRPIRNLREIQNLSQRIKSYTGLDKGESSNGIERNVFRRVMGIVADQPHETVHRPISEYI